MHISQPPLSLSIRQLEEELGTQLFTRTRQSVELTRSGLTFLERAQLILLQLPEAVDVTRAVSRGMLDHIVVGFNPTSSYDVLPRIMPRFCARFPDVSVRFEDLATAEQESALLQKRIDVALFLAPTDARRSIRQEIFHQERLVAALPDSHALVPKKEIDLRQPKHEAFIFLPSRQQTGYQARVLYACQEAGFTPDVVQQVDRIHNLVSLVASGLGVALCPASLQYFAPPGVAFRALKDPLSL